MEPSVLLGAWVFRSTIRRVRPPELISLLAHFLSGLQLFSPIAHQPISSSAHELALGQALSFGFRACTYKIAIGGSDLINVRFTPLCGLKLDISRRPRSAITRPEQVQQTEAV